jgi:hypothetical protein
VVLPHPGVPVTIKRINTWLLKRIKNNLEEQKLDITKSARFAKLKCGQKIKSRKLEIFFKGKGFILKTPAFRAKGPA